MKKFNKKGFTLIELLVVIAIIGLLATLAVVALGNARLRARDAKRVSDIKQIQTALELRFVQAENYPAEGAASANLSLGLGNITCLDDVGFGGAGQAGTCATPVYMGLIPSDPSSTGTMCTSATETAVCDYAYDFVTANSYQIFFWLEGATGGLATGDHCANQNGIANSDSCA